MSERIWSRKKILESAIFLKTLREITGALNHADVRYALIGGLAVAYHANPPVTIDADFLVDTDNMDILEILFRGEGWEVYPLIFATKQRGFPKYGWALRKKGRTDIDIISTSRDRYLSRVVSGAIPTSLGGVRVPMVTAEDLIVMKTLVGREKDLDDATALRMKMKVDEKYIRKTLDGLL
jgi:predicted nucleotidyltransferase